MSTHPLRVGADDQVRILMRAARRKPLLSSAEEVRLAKQIERGDLAAKERMIESNLRLVFTIARCYRGRGVPYADLVQEGSVGLVRAVERFDHRRGLKFSTYAAWWIRRSLLDAIAGSQMIRIPAKANQQLAAVRRAETELERARPWVASTTDVADRTGLSTRRVQTLRDAARVTASLDDRVDEDGTPLVELVVDDKAVDPPDSAMAAEDLRELTTMLRFLPGRHREVLVRRYGLRRQEAQSHEEIGAWLGVGEERSRQIEREALSRLRAIAGRCARAA